ncbi:peptidoglycan DD-metalloendopeptidase family protein [Streptomyces sp. NPDC001922]|uniref:peptidoglycan DD-metalloendopeptidase family protein n=1 Tax=Streptomyces sp. NPDC001922 TaxID=3364624 RepID=UPI00368D2F5B
MPGPLGLAPVPSAPAARPLTPTGRGTAPLGCSTSRETVGTATATGSGATANTPRRCRPPGAGAHGSAGVPRCASGAHARARGGEAARRIRTQWAAEGGRAGQGGWAGRLAAGTTEAAPPAGRPAPHRTVVAAPAGPRERASDERRPTPGDQPDPAPDGPGAGEPSIGRAWPVGGPDAGARPEVVRGWAPPPSPYSAGHRGVDLAARPGGTVRAAAAGRVSFAGSVAGRPVLVIELDGTGSPPLRITYEPVRPTVRKGDRVTAGQPVGTLDGRSHCPAGCLHWGLRRGDRYLDPLSLLPAWMLRGGPSRLLPVFGVPEPQGTAPSGHGPAPSPGADRPATAQGSHVRSDPGAGPGSRRAGTDGGGAHRAGADTGAPDAGGADASRADTGHTGASLAGAVRGGASFAGGGFADAGRTGAGRATAHGTADRPTAGWAGHRATAPPHPTAGHGTGVARGGAPTPRTPPELSATGPDKGLPGALPFAGALITAAWWAHRRLNAGPRGPAPAAPRETTGTQVGERASGKAHRQGPESTSEAAVSP